ncbi:MAG: hypothetical protein HY681_09950 [Chloroflexi bacterium]|nr:hypothetical protein [Chloroflexota bacterium]
MAEFNVSTWDGAIEMLVTFRIEPYMNPYPEVVGRKVAFRRIRGAKGHVRPKYTQKVWEQVIHSLHLDSEEKVAHVRHIVYQRIAEKPK